MPPLPLDERIVVIQRPKNLALRVASPPTTSQSSSRLTSRNKLPTHSPQPQPPLHHPCTPFSSLSLECRHRPFSRIQKAKDERGTTTEVNSWIPTSQAGSSSCSYCSSDPIVVTFNPHRGKPPNIGHSIGTHTMGGYQHDDDDYSVRTIWPEELAKKMTRSKTQSSRNGTNPVILDCQNLLEFTRSQLTDHAGRRRLQQGKMAVLDFMGSGSSRDPGRDSLKRLWNKGADAGMGDSDGLDDDMLPRSPSLNSLRPDIKECLCDECLSAEGLCFSLVVHLSLPLSSSLPASLSDESIMTPDVENAVVSPILPFLFLGNERDAQDLDLLLRLNVSYVVNVTTHLPLYHVDTGLVRYKRLPATDNSKQNLRQYFEEVFEFIEEAHQSGRGVLVHCQAGVSRSATIVIAYLMKHTLMTMTDAYKYVRSRRPVVSPNLNFMGQLLEFERDLNSGVTPRILTPKLSGLETQV
uniref:protein-tyrosine-phosphatase n=1 Tax=Electrophorus electricus TaxID=8005 RepID=A0A4W4DXD4_ELEEL